MGFLDKAKNAANELAAKADTALAGSGLGGPGGGLGGFAGPGGTTTERLLRDLGVLTWLAETGRPVPDGERDRVLAALRDADARGEVRDLTLRSGATAPSSVPPPPGAAGAPPPPPPPASAQGAPSAPPPPPTSAPPPPPSWAG